MNLNFKNKNIFITGSTKGIGFDIAKSFADSGANVVINSRTLKDCEKASNLIQKSQFVCGDMSSPSEAESILGQVLSALGSLDILVCNIGSGKSASPGKDVFQDWDNMFSKNFYTTVNAVDAARPFLEQSQGSIVCISSICGHEVIKGAPISYSVAKAALNSYIKGMAWPLGKENIRINGVSPGNINFLGSSWERKIEDQKESVEAMLLADVPQNRFGRTSEIASAVLFVASENSSFTTGSIVVVDGGQSRN
jgi:3-oxoacyl-[acyl-carrier protein] reductase